MKSIARSLDADILKIFKRIGIMAKTRAAYAVGGIVRDLFLGRPILDLDVVIEQDAIKVAREFALEFHGRVTAYPQFGTATVRLPSGRLIDFATTRRERYPSPGALPVVEAGSIRDDLFRRDFTINAMAFSIKPENFGELMDCFAGADDLKKKRIRVLYDKSFLDDPTRILRAVRFEQRFNFHIEPKTLRLLKAAIRVNAVDTVKPQRYFEELKKNLNEPLVVENILRLIQLRGLMYFHPVMVKEPFLRALLKEHRTLSDGSLEQWVVFLMAVVGDQPESTIARILRSFAVSKEVSDKILSSISSGEHLKRLKHASARASLAFEVLRPLSIEELIFLRARTKDDLIRQHIKNHIQHWRHLKLKINGLDLQNLGIPSGKIFKEILDKVMFALVDGQAPSRKQQLARARDIYQQTLLK